MHHYNQPCLSEESFIVFITFYKTAKYRDTARFLNRNKMYKFIAAVKTSVNQQSSLILLFHTENYLESLCLSFFHGKLAKYYFDSPTIICIY